MERVSTSTNADRMIGRKKQESWRQIGGEKIDFEAGVLPGAGHKKAKETRELERKFATTNKWKTKRKQSTRCLAPMKLLRSSLLICNLLYLLSTKSQLTLSQQQPDTEQPVQEAKLPDLVGATSDEPIVAVVGQDAFISCVAKNLQNYTIIWRYTNDANAPGQLNEGLVNQATQSGNQATTELGAILTAGKQRVISDDRFTIIQSHDTWLLKVSNVRQSDSGTYICHTNSSPRVRAIRILSVVKPTSGGSSRADSDSTRPDHFDAIDYNFTDCCRAEYVTGRCQRLCSFQQLASRYQGINMVHECYSALPSITRCMVAGRNVTDCCQRRHIPAKCNPMCGHLGDTSAMSLQDQTYCADYSAAIMSCVAEGISTLPGQPELVIVEAISSGTLKVSWQKVSDEKELAKIDGWIINLTKLSSFEDTIGGLAKSSSTQSQSSADESKLAQTSPASGGRVTSSFSSSSSSSAPNSPTTPLASLTIVDVMNNSSLAAMTKLLAASSGTISLKLDKNSNEFSIDNLKPYTVYQIQMFAYNSKGRSQLTDPIRALTLAPESELPATAEQNAQDGYVEPNLPDTRKCCLDRGVTLKRCLDTMCDPIEADRATIADLMICAPWSNVTFSCLSSRVNHTDCCRSRGVSPFCLNMCSGEVKRVDYRHFRCLTHMSTYTNCILESHDVLPSRPLNFTVGPITHTWAVLNWRPPRKHARSLQGYRIFWRRVDPATTSNSTGQPAANSTGQLMGDNSFNAAADDDFFYASAEAATNPYLLDALQPGTVYETFVVAVNKFGQSESSVRFVFQTLADPEELMNSMGAGQQGEIESRLPLQGNATASKSNPASFYNETSCCANGGVHNSCLQLCDYDVKVSDASALVTSCSMQMPVILRCLAGSRNSVPCCRSRGVNDQCLNVCAGLTELSPLVVATRCASDFGKIIRCMDEGSKQIPSAPVDLHTLDIRSDRISIKWQPAAEDALRSDVEYHVRYQQLQPPAGGDSDSAGAATTEDPSSLIAVVPLHPLEHNLILTTNKTEATIDKLQPNSRYSVYVTAENGYGISLPSLVLVAQTPGSELDGADQSQLEPYKRRATLGAPHSLEILRSDTESIVLKWIAPLFINNDAQVKYRVFYKLLATANSTSPQPADNSTLAAANQQVVATNWTVIETSDTTLILRNLRYSSQYAITVQAFSRNKLGHMSEILLANTAKPVPPTLNHPLVINNPIEGNNITIMCVALGQPTPQISMYINGLLVQKRTQPYVIYHLVNLVRGHLTITCFASNGHGKDYASVQSRTEVSVKFPSKVSARVKEVRANSQSTARMTCEVSGNPQPTVIWVFTPEGQTVNGSHSRIVVPSERITTLLVSQFENPFTWSHTLTIRNVSQSDHGIYQCKSRNLLSESTDAIRLIASEPFAGELPASSSSASGAAESASAGRVEPESDLMECCRSQNVSAKCLPVCSVDGLDVETAFKTSECHPHLNKLMFCAADGSDHRNCCRTRQVPSTCLRWCSGAKVSSTALCFLSSAIDVNQCFQEGRSLLPGPPRNIRVLLASESEHGAEVGGPQEGAASPGPITQTMTINGPTGGMPFVAAGESSRPASVIASMASMMGDAHAGDADQATESAPTATPPSGAAPDLQVAEPIVVEWDPPAKNPSLVQYYRIFWRPVNSRELSRTITNQTWIRLADLNVNRQYELVVKAANSHGSSVHTESRRFSPAELMAQSNSIASAGLIWFMPSTGGAAPLIGRVMAAICFATLFMFSSLALVMFLEKRGYLKRFASSKSNSSRISFANPAYLKDGDANVMDAETVVTWESGHSLDILAPQPQPQQTNNNAAGQNGPAQNQNGKQNGTN